MVEIKQAKLSFDESMSVEKADEMISFGLFVKEGRRPEKITVE